MSQLLTRKLCPSFTKKSLLQQPIITQRTMSTTKDLTNTQTSFVTTNWLYEKLTTNPPKPNEPRIIPIDASWHLKPLVQRDGLQEYLQSHIPTSRHFDLDSIKDKITTLPHMLPPVDEFEESMGSELFGLKRSDHVVLYDSYGLFSAPRVYWTFKYFGHPLVSVLKGGLKAWKHEGKPLESVGRRPVFEKTEYKVDKVNDDLVIAYDDLLAHVIDFQYPKNYVIVDARSAGRFMGTEPEPRPNLPSGHIPGSLNLPFTKLINQETGTLHPTETLRNIFKEHGIDTTRPLVMTCGSGVTASVLYLAAKEMGVEDVRVYDGSWSEWASKKKSPIQMDVMSAYSQ